jgi:hypothetical protein
LTLLDLRIGSSQRILEAGRLGILSLVVLGPWAVPAMALGRDQILLQNKLVPYVVRDNFLFK